MIHPTFEELRRDYADTPHPSLMTFVERRERYRRECLSFQGAVQAVGSVRMGQINCGDHSVGYRQYAPLDDEGQGLVVYVHGGSFVAGDLDTHDEFARRLTSDLSMSLLSIDYRLAPEHPFPAGLNDVVDAMRYVATHRGEFTSGDAKVLLLGDSAGATLVAVAAAMTKDEGLDIAGQILVSPSMGPDVVTDSVNAFGTGYFFEVEHLHYDYENYLAGFSNHSDPRISPLLASDLVGVPAAIVVVAEYDPLRDEGVAYAGLLEHFGVEVEILEAQGMVHGFIKFANVISEALNDIDDIARHMRRLTA